MGVWHPSSDPPRDEIELAPSEGVGKTAETAETAGEAGEAGSQTCRDSAPIDVVAVTGTKHPTRRPISDVARLDRLPYRQLIGSSRVHVAVTTRSRLLGLAGLDAMPVGTAVLFPRCRSIHTVGMRFLIDVAFLDESGVVVRQAKAVKPWRLRSCRGAAAVLECAAGELPRFLAGLIPEPGTRPPREPPPIVPR